MRAHKCAESLRERILDYVEKEGHVNALEVHLQYPRESQQRCLTQLEGLVENNSLYRLENGIFGNEKASQYYPEFKKLRTNLLKYIFFNQPTEYNELLSKFNNQQLLDKAITKLIRSNQIKRINDTYTLEKRGLRKEESTSEIIVELVREGSQQNGWIGNKYVEDALSNFGVKKRSVQEQLTQLCNIERIHRYVKGFYGMDAPDLEKLEENRENRQNHILSMIEKEKLIRSEILDELEGTFELTPWMAILDLNYMTDNKKIRKGHAKRYELVLDTSTTIEVKSPIDQLLEQISDQPFMPQDIYSLIKEHMGSQIKPEDQILVLKSKGVLKGAGLGRLKKA
tara:strand:+ start:1193 stop:2212 length:1020 start_codon:yes stop_codon:yes gene_type:complete